MLDGPLRPPPPGEDDEASWWGGEAQEGQVLMGVEQMARGSEDGFGVLLLRLRVVH